VLLPAVGSVGGLALAPTHTTCYVSTSGSRTVAPGIWSVELTDGSARQMVTTSAAPGPIATSRFGDLFYVDGGDLRRIPADYAGGSGPIPGCPLPAPAPSIAYDDSNDTVVVCSAADDSDTTNDSVFEPELPSATLASAIDTVGKALTASIARVSNRSIPRGCCRFGRLMAIAPRPGTLARSNPAQARSC
jgi:hypothetical protein